MIAWVLRMVRGQGIAIDVGGCSLVGRLDLLLSGVVMWRIGSVARRTKTGRSRMVRDNLVGDRRRDDVLHPEAEGARG